MDLGIGLDARAIFRACRHETLKWLSGNGYTDQHAHLSEWLLHAEDPSTAPSASRQVRVAVPTCVQQHGVRPSVAPYHLEADALVQTAS